MNNDSFFFDKRLRALISAGFRLSDGSQSSKKFWYAVSAVSTISPWIKTYSHYIDPHVLCCGIITQKVVKALGIQSI